MKHWAVYNQETNRNTAADDAVISQRAMHEIYMPQFEAAVTQGKAASVMCSYSSINGQYACQNSDIMNVLKKQWHFPGFVTSDWGATHSTVPSALAGLDMQMPGGQGFGTDYYGAPLKQAVQAGQVPMATLDGMVSRILTEMFRFRLFDRPPAGSLTAVVTTPGHAQVGRQVAETGTVLLKNAGDQHDGSLIVNTDHIIVVSINYRLGPFGFLDLPGLGTSALTGSGNFGLLDQEAALRWVQRNIAGFGGNPGEVTIDGESAGGWSMCALMTSPPARGLFRAAIMQSGSCATQTRATAQAASLAFAKQAGCPDPATAAACLRGLPEKTLLDASASYQPLFTSGGPELPVPAAQAVASGHYNRVPLLIGTNHNEGRTFAQGFTAFTQQQADQLITSEFGSRAPAILARYPWSSYPSPYTAAYMIGDIWTDSGFLTGIGGCPEQNLAAQFAATTPTFFYQFDDLHAPGLNNDHPGYQWGAGHAMELAYLWLSFNNGFSLYDLLTPAQLELSRQMVRY